MPLSRPPTPRDQAVKTNARPSRFAHYIVTKGWAHVVLLSGVGVFLFPFLWMLSTSLKTDEELPAAAVLPRVPRFHPLSPYVRETAPPAKPTDVAAGRWEAMLPALLQLADQRIYQLQQKTPDPAWSGGAKVSQDEHRRAAAQLLVDQLVAKMNVKLWAGGDKELLAEFNHLLDESAGAAVEGALQDALARMELGTVQLRTLPGHLLTETSGIAGSWSVESGPGQIVTTGGARRIAYDFSASAAAPVVLRYEFAVPAALKSDDLHKLAVAIKTDDSWHRLDVTLDWGTSRWVSTRTTYAAQHRTMTVMLQPPTFDDTTDRARTWIPIRADGPRQDGARSQTPGTATLRLIISPSSTVVANYGKAQRNYLRAFLSVPFWKYVGNSVILVALMVAGALFSSSFVAYAFARLHWPGRGVALVLLLATMMLPSQVTMIPSFMIWREMGWYNTLNPLWVPAWFGNAFFIFLMVQHMKTIPRELEEAARLDGLNSVQTWWYIILPQVKPTLAAVAIMTFQGAWNEFMGPLIYLRDQAKFPLSLGLFGMRVDQGGDWTMLMAGNMLMTLPVILVFFLFQRYFIQGMTMSGIKG